MEYEAVIGLEIHVQLRTKTKLFCGCRVVFGAPPNTNVCPVCLGLPGALPVPNGAALELAIRAALALGCRIAPVTKFDRKNYCYPDLPKNYQISQYDTPLATGGYLDIAADGMEKRVGITRVHLEEDAGKLLHDESGRGGCSLVDLNRAGVPLLEIVSGPDMRSPEEARAYMEALAEIMEHIGASDCNMQEGNLRCDANVSIRPRGAAALGIKTEIKNLNSFRFVEQALRYEIKRQVGTVSSGGRLVQETRLFDPDAGETRPLRSKESAHDYRYFPDPDLPPIAITEERIESIRATVGELPRARRARYVSAMGLSAYEADVLVRSRAAADYFEALVAAGVAPKPAANWMLNDVQAALKAAGLDSIEKSAAPPERMAEMIKLVESGAVGRGPAKEVLLPELLARGADPMEVAKSRDLLRSTDAGAVERAVEVVVAANPKQVAEYRGGKAATFNWLLGQAMKALRGKGDPKAVREALLRKLGGG
ncbi:MAG: Asp-tRNA(Asn)/Glu-tRNA(Gln) amidotransferase subunit GatB [Planctomycetota bacterium]|nr:Asp-tRNA(Asn)/Glu-tRNA(Gln) amidotransferase subunit GatB [Planctomycetota bacterium]